MGRPSHFQNRRRRGRKPRIRLQAAELGEVPNDSKSRPATEPTPGKPTGKTTLRMNGTSIPQLFFFMFFPSFGMLWGPQPPALFHAQDRTEVISEVASFLRFRPRPIRSVVGGPSEATDEKARADWMPFTGSFGQGGPIRVGIATGGGRTLAGCTKGPVR